MPSQDTYLRIYSCFNHFVDVLVNGGIIEDEISEILDDGMQDGRMMVQPFSHLFKPKLQIIKIWKPFITDCSSHAVNYKRLEISPSNLGT